MRLSVQRRLGLPLDVACQAAAAGKKTRNKKIHDEFGDAAVNVPQQSHNTRHKCVLQRLILALRAAWGTAVRMEPKAHLGQSYNKQPDVDADNIGKDGTHYCGDVKVVCSLSSSGEHGRKGAFVAFGNTESFYRNMVEGHGGGEEEQGRVCVCVCVAMAKNSSRGTPRAYALARREAHAPRRGGRMRNDAARDAFRGPEIKLLMPCVT